MGTKKSNLDITDIHNKIIDFLLINGMQIIIAIAILISGLYISKWCTNFIQKWLKKKNLEPQLISLDS